MSDTMFEKENFDVIVHLLGEQRLPVYLGIRQFKCPRHIIVHSGVRSELQDSLMRLVGGENKIEGIKIDPYDPHVIRQTILSALGDTSGRVVGFDLLP